MLLTRGHKGLYPCPVCLVPIGKQHMMGKHWPLRNVKKLKAIVLNKTLTATAKEVLLKDMGMRDVPVSAQTFCLIDTDII